MWRADAEDQGMVGVVKELGRGSEWKTKVTIVWDNPSGRKPRDYDYVAGQPIVIEWRHLTASANVQRHRTARLMLNSTNDNDGWVEYEQLSRGE